MTIERYLWIFIVLVLLVGGCAGSTHVNVRPDVQTLTGKTVAALDFDYEPGKEARQLLYGGTWTPKAGQIVADQISDALLGCNDIRIIERSRISRVLEEQQKWVTDLIKKGDYKEIGELFGADYLIFGTVNEHCAIGIIGIVRGFVAFSARCVNVETGEVVWSTSVSDSSLYTSPTTISGRLANGIVSKLKSELNKKTKSGIKKTSGTNIIPLRKHE